MEWETPAASTLAAWWGAATGSVALLVNWLNRRDAVREQKKKAKAAQPWVTLSQMPAHPEMPMLCAWVHNPTETELTITQIEVLKPKGGKIAIVYLDRGVPEDVVPPGAKVTVNWQVHLPGPKGAAEPSGSGDFRLALPTGGSPRTTRTPSSERPQIEVEIALMAAATSPNVDPVRIKAKATITP